MVKCLKTVCKIMQIIRVLLKKLKKKTYVFELNLFILEKVAKNVKYLRINGKYIMANLCTMIIRNQYNLFGHVVMCKKLYDKPINWFVV